MEINDHYKILFEKIIQNQENILKKIDYLEKTIKLVYHDSTIENLKELKYEELIVDKYDVLKALKYTDYRTIIYIFRLLYRNKNNENYAYPIRISGKRSFEYYANGKWNPDLYGHHSMNVICSNMQNLFMNYNTMDEFKMDDFMNYQTFIFKLSNKKYKKEIFKNIIEEIRIYNL